MPAINSGRPPDPNSRNQQKQNRDGSHHAKLKAGSGGWITLPREGRKGTSPKWPDGYQVNEIAMKLWHKLWHTPQAAAWERDGEGFHYLVARYCWLTSVVTDDYRVLAELRQIEDRIGLNPPSMLRNRWVMANDEIGDARDDRQASTQVAREAADRLKITDVA